MNIKDLPDHEKPREKLMEKGPQGLKDKELLAILLRTGRKGKSALDIAESILAKYTKKKLTSLGYDDLIRMPGIDSGKACALLAAFELSHRAFDREDNSLPVIKTAADAVVHLQNIRNNKKEHLVALYLNARQQLIHQETISVGTLDTNIVHPREVFYPAVRNPVSGVIVAHNHPSGDLAPSSEDIEITDRLKRAGEILGIDLIDHIIVTKESFRSLREENKF
jgi:DNA repair protein RadC